MIYRMNKYEVERVAIVGIGGSGAYYVAKFLLLCGVDVVGFDLKNTSKTKGLEKLGAKITYRNPKESFGDVAYFIYTHNLPEKVVRQLIQINPGIDAYEVGEMYKSIIGDFEDGLLSESQQEAFYKSDLAPLYSLDLKDTRVIGITGTDGKTTSCTMIYHILKNNGFNPALISTISAKIGDKEISTGFHTTTPTSQELFNLFNQALDSGCTHIIVEVTSHGLEQGRVAGIKFDTIGYTNVTKEHLDYHKTYERYLKAKSLLIREHSKPSSVIVLNMDDTSYDFLNSISLGRSMKYAVENKDADITATNIDDIDGLKFNLSTSTDSFNVHIPIYGKYNVSNFLLACGVCMNEGVEIEDIVKSISSFKGVVGRMELIQQNPFKVFVDFAHTPNATLKALETVKTITKGKVIHVFGCAGLRDSTKRYGMGKISNQFSDITILTAEDPRTENLEEINDEIERGWRDGGRRGKLIRFDRADKNVEVRRDAIKKAIKLAKDGDTIIITGKAHEKSLCFGDTEYDWNDINEVQRLLKP
jgi:UDP-N-acetylmuramoyl-L-alanyl-D-glutamate--2,6-diaminopimelate ligase